MDRDLLEVRCAAMKVRLLGWTAATSTTVKPNPATVNLQPLWRRERYGKLNEPLRWSRSVTMAVSNADCVHCTGSGMMRDNVTPCSCALRNIFRTCRRRYRFIQSNQVSFAPSLRPMRNDGPTYKLPTGRRNEDYCADFVGVSRRALAGSPLRSEIFECHVLRGWQHPQCCRRLKIDRGTFFHVFYDMEKRLGRVFCELRPYSLFPLDNYFSGISLEDIYGEDKEFLLAA